MNCICVHERIGLNWGKMWGGVGVADAERWFSSRSGALDIVICLLWYRGSSCCLIVNMLDGKLWLFSSRQKTEGEISSPVSFDLQPLPISSAKLPFLLVWAALQVCILVQTYTYRRLQCDVGTLLSYHCWWDWTSAFCLLQHHITWCNRIV